MKLLLASVLLTTTLALMASEANGQFGFINDIVCATTSMPAITRCGEKFAEELNYSDGQPIEEYRRLTYCCAFNHLRDCIVDNTDKNCQDSAQVIEKLVSGFVNTVKKVSDPNHDCEVFTGTVGKVLCQPTWLLVVEGITLVLLFLCGLCSVLQMCCGSRKGRHVIYHRQNMMS